MAFFTVNGSSNHSGPRPLVLYISVGPSRQQGAGNDGRQRIYEDLTAATSFPFDFRPFRVNGDDIFDEIMTLLLAQLTEDDFRRLQMIIVNGYSQNQTGTLGETFSGAFFKVILLALLHR